jgi:hypothetical protein
LLVLSLTLSLSEVRLLGAEPVQSKAGILAIEAGIVKSRRDLHSGRVVIRLHENTFARSPAATRVDRRHTVYFKGDKWRADLERLDLSSGASVPLSKIVWTNDHYIRDFGNDQVVQLFGSNTKPPMASEIPDPRRLGLVAWFFESINQFAFETYFLGPDRQDLRMEPGVDEAGRPIEKVTYSIGRGQHKPVCEYWLTASGQGRQPIYIAVKSGEGDRVYEQSIRTKLKSYPQPAIWYPSEVKFRIISAGRLQTEEVALVEDAAFNQELPDSVFSIEGLGLPIGRVIDSDGHRFTWDGDSLVPEGPFAARAHGRHVPLEQRIASLNRDAHLVGMRLLVLLLGDSSKDVTTFGQQIWTSEDPPEILRLLPLVVSAKESQSEIALFTRLGWEPPKTGEIAFIALDGTGTRLADRRLMIAGNVGLHRQLAEFIKQSAPPVRDAQAILTAAEREARETQRRLLFVEGGPRCGPCLRLARWLDDQHALLAKDYVVVKVLQTDEHSRQVIGKFNPRRDLGVPWFAIAEPDGAVLVTSVGPSGNMGFPTSVEGKRLLKTMLERTARRLTVAERDRLLQSISAGPETLHLLGREIERIKCGGSRSAPTPIR